MEETANILSFNLHIRSFFGLIIFGALAFVAFRLIKRFIAPLILNRKVQDTVQRYVPVAERGFWALFIFASAFLVIATQPLIGGILILILVVALWMFLRNYLAGLILLLSSDLRVGQKIRTDDRSGTISALKPFFCEIELDNGELFTISNMELSAKPLIKASRSEKVLNRTITVQIAKPCNIEIEQETLYRKLIAVPWLLPSDRPVIEIYEETPDYFKLKTVVRGIDKEHLNKVERGLRGN